MSFIDSRCSDLDCQVEKTYKEYLTNIYYADKAENVTRAQNLHK